MCLGGILYGYCCNEHGNYELTTLPLIGASSSVKIVDSLAQVELKQRYENQNPSPIEATYEYPLPEDAAVSKFIIEVDGKVINAKIKEKEKAQEIYDDAIAEGHGAYLLEQTTDTRFRTSVGNLPPGKAVLITIVYVQKLEFVDGELEFIMPTTQNAPNGRGNSKQFEKPKNDTFDDVVPYGVKIDATIQMRSPIVSLTSPNYALGTTISSYQGQQTATAGLHITTGYPLMKHWVLRIKLANEHEPTARVQAVSEKQSVAMVSFYPEVDEEGVFSEIVFVVDRSGSMAGDKMKRVKETLELFLRSLPEGTMFNIVSFGTKFHKKFPQSVEYNEKNFTEAMEYVKKMFANMMGTNIIEPLQSVLCEPLLEGVPRQIFLLTDGEVDNRDECINTVKKYAKTTRVFTFGIGREADGNLVKDMARAGNGRHEIITDNNDMEEKVMRHLSYALRPALIEPKLDWGTLNVINTAPYHCPPLFAGNQIVFYAFVPANTSGKHDVTITAKGPKGHYNAKVSINFDEKVEDDFISKLAARAMIDDLATGRSSMHSDDGTLNKKFKPKDVNDAIIQLSLTNQVMSKLTAFVAVEKRREATIGTMNSVNVNNMHRYQGPVGRGRGGYGMGVPMPPGAPIPFGVHMQQQGPIHLLGADLDLLVKSGSSPTGRRSSLTLGSTSSVLNGGPPPPPSIGGGPPPPPGGAPPPLGWQMQQQGPPAPKAPQAKGWKSADRSAEPASRLSRSGMDKEQSHVPEDDDFELSAEGSMMNSFVPSKPTSDPAAKEAVRAVIQQQAFSGSFDLKTLTSLARKVKLEKVREVLTQCGIAVSAKSEAAAVTLMVAVLFELKFSELKSVWDLVAKKAKTFAKKELGGIDIVPLETAAKTYLATAM